MTQLFLEGCERRRLDAAVSQRLEASLAQAAAGPVVPEFDARKFRRELAEIDFADRKEIDGVIAWVLESLRAGMTHTTHARYFGLFNPRPSTASELADRIVAG